MEPQLVTDISFHKPEYGKDPRGSATSSAIIGFDPRVGTKALRLESAREKLLHTLQEEADAGNQPAGVLFFWDRVSKSALHREKSLSEDSVLAQSFVLYDGVSPPPPPASEDSEESVEALMISM